MTGANTAAVPHGIIQTKKVTVIIAVRKMANYKRKTHRKRIWRKEIGNSAKVLSEWSRMLHLWWKRWLYDKKDKTDTGY